MNTMRVCGGCQQPLVADAPDGLCPECLMRAALETNAAVGGTCASQGPANAQGVASVFPETVRTEDHKAVPLAEGEGSVIGPYKLLERIGEGGMAVVYMAEQDRPIRRRVALKMIKVGMDTREVIARFEAERQALALMDHPNIARVFDAGATGTGRPYFVMELVSGISVTEYCDRNRLSTRERLELFIAVCNAVHHAHQKGILHRDLKPSNILVTLHDGVPVPKVIDFGIAKALNQRLTEKTLFTRHAEMIGTPAYMSPEQAEMSGLDVDIRTDIYSLGIVLYELLSGAMPFDPQTFQAAAVEGILRTIREEEPPRPSTRLSKLGEAAQQIARARRTDVRTLTRSLQQELEWIPLKAMRKDRTQRYRSAYEFADDIRNYLNGAALIAGPESAAYRLRKVLRKHRVPVAATAAVLAVILIGFVTSTYLYLRMRQARSAVVTLERTVEADRRLAAAQRLQAEGRYAAALQELEKDPDPKRSPLSVRLLRANLLHALDRFGEAEAELKRLVDGPPEIAGPAHGLLAAIYVGRDPARASAHQQASESLLPRTAEACYLRGMAAEGSQATLEWLSQGMELDPSHYPLRKARALAAYSVRDYTTMASDAETLIALRPKDALGYELRAIARRELGQLAAAIEDHQRALAICDSDAELPGLHDQRRQTLMRMRQYHAALKDAEICAALRPDELRHASERLVTLALSGDYAGVTTQYRKLAAHPRYRSLSLCLYRSTFRLLLAGHSLELPEGLIRQEPFSLMQKAIEQYRVCQSFGSCLVPSSFGVAAWSPDGKELAYGTIDQYSLGDEPSTGGAPLVYESGALEALDLESRRVRVLVPSARDCAWSPDGRWIAFGRAPNRGTAGCVGELWLLPAAGGPPRYLANGAWPTWAGPDGLVFYQSGGAAYSLNVNETSRKPELTLSCPPYFAVSPDAKYLAYSSQDKLTVVEIPSGKVKATWTAPPPEGEHGMALKWAPNGKEVLAGGLHGAELGLWSYDLEQGKAWQLFPSPAVLGSPSPDGSRMAIEIRNSYGGTWLAKLDPADSIHAGVRSARTEEQYLQQSCGDFAKAIRRGTYRSNEVTHLRGFLVRVSTLAEDYCQKRQYQDALDTFLGLEALGDALNRQPDSAALAVAIKSFHGLGRRAEAETMLERLRRLAAGHQDGGLKNALYETEKTLAGETTELGKLWQCLEEQRIDEAARQLLTMDTREDLGRVRQDLAEALYQRGRAHKHHGGTYGQAMDDYAMALKVNPDHRRARADLAWLQAACPVMELQDPDDAVANATLTCQQTGWKDHPYLATLAAVCAQVGDYPAAISRQRQALDLLTQSDKSVWQRDYESRLRGYERAKLYERGDLWSFTTGRLLGRWRFDGDSKHTVPDASGNGHEGTIIGTPRWEPSPGRMGGALRIHRSFVRIDPESPFDVTEAMTLSAWIRIESFETWWQALITKGDSAWRIHRSGDRDCLEFHCSGLQSPSGEPATAKGLRAVADDRWHHVAATYDGSRLALYIDGQLDASCPARGTLATNDFPVLIGENAEQPERYWNGWIGEVRIYSYALTEEEVKSLHLRNATVP